MTPKQQDDIYAAGVAAFNAGLSPFSNPYMDLNTPLEQFIAWATGWSEAKEREQSTDPQQRGVG